MNKELFDSMQKQMTPSPQVRAALSEKLARPVKKRPSPWMKYGAVAACAALVIGTVGAYSLRQNPEAWMLITRSFNRDVAVQRYHSYVTVEGMTGYTTENTTVDDLGGSTGTGGVNAGGPFNRDDAPSGALPGGADIGDVPVQEGAEDYQKLMERFNGTYPDWYGGAYLNSSGRLVVQLVESKDPADKSLELQVLDWTGSDTVMFSSCKYSRNQLNELMNRLNALPDTDPACRAVMAGWGVDEEANRIDLTLTEANNHILSVLAELDPEDDAIYVQVGQRATADVGIESPAVSHVVPGGATVPDDENPIAEEPWVDDTDGAHYDIQPRPAENLPQSKLPAITEDSVPEEDFSPAPEQPVHGPADSFTPAYDPAEGFICPNT